MTVLGRAKPGGRRGEHYGMNCEAAGKALGTGCGKCPHPAITLRSYLVDDLTMFP